MSRIYTIYMCVNKVNDKCYVGFDSSWPRRIKSHFNEATNLNSHTYKTIFHNALRKHGKESFDWVVLYQSHDKEHTLNYAESYFIRENNSFWKDGGYNSTLGGEGQVGRIMSEETRIKKSKALMNRPSKQSRTVVTPYGTFPGIQMASRALNLHTRIIQTRVKSPYQTEWYFEDSPKPLRPPKKLSGAIKTPKTIMTSHGQFKSVTDCAAALNISKSTIMARIKSRKQLDWYYV